MLNKEIDELYETESFKRCRSCTGWKYKDAARISGICEYSFKSHMYGDSECQHYEHDSPLGRLVKRLSK